ncbi:MAG: tetratricopeptide repeat protein [Bacteroidia bacterium]|nr:tetratricopeptide repeat protein [Bacteroidia bacterium]NNM22115.1 tetratricopeptide repeat protein [Flavobacteriaceae bacterium]
MKKLVLLVGIMLISTFTFAQKKEVKKAEKAIKNGEVAEAISLLNQAEGLIAGADSDLQSQFYLTKAEAYLADAGNNNFDKMKTAAKAIGKAEELGNADAERLSIVKQNLRVALVNSAINDQNAKNYASASEKLYTSYMTNKKDTSDLYYAAGNSVNGKDYTTAVGYYKTLLDLGYTGIRTEYVATELETEKVVAFADKGERDLALLTGNYTKPEERKTESVKGDILQKITLIYVSQGENEKALEFMKSAREANPDDTDLIRSEADLAYKMGDMAKYDKLMNEVVKVDPNNPELYYNLGVSAGQLGDDKKAKEYYRKAMELKPNYDLAQINMAALLLKGEGAIVEEMNGLGTSAADDRRYEELKQKRVDLYKEVLPYLESAVATRGDNVELVRTLMNIYSQLAMDDKYKAMKAKLANMEGGE